MMNQEFTKKVEDFQTIKEQVETFVRGQRLSPTSFSQLKQAQVELKRTSDVAFVSASENHSEISELLDLDPDILDESVLRIGSVGSSDAQSTDALDILFPEGKGNCALLAGRNILVIAPGMKHIIKNPVVKTLQTADALIFAINKRITETDASSMRLAISLTRSKANPQIAAVYTAKDLTSEELQTLISANDADAFGDVDTFGDVEIKNYIASIDDEKLIADIQRASDMQRISVMRSCVESILLDVESNISNLENYRHNWKSELAVRQTYDRAVEKRSEFHTFKRSKRAQLDYKHFKSIFKEIRRELLRKKITPYNAGKVMRAISYRLSTLSNSDLHKSNIKTTIEELERLIRRECDDALIRAAHKGEDELTKYISGELQSLVEDVVQRFDIPEDDYDVTVEYKKPSVEDRVTRIAHWQVKVERPVSRQVFTFVISTSLFTSIGIALGGWLGGFLGGGLPGAIIGGIAGGIFGAGLALKVIDDETTGQVRAKLETAARGVLIELESVIREEFDECVNLMWQSITKRQDEVFDATEKFIEAQIQRMTDVPGYTVDELQKAIKEGESQLEELNALKRDIVHFL